MSSKNPFRQSVQPPATPTSPRSDSERSFAAVFDAPPTADPEQRRSSKTKRVRIQTPPPLSPESTRGSIVFDDPPSSLVEKEGQYLGSLPLDIVTDDSSDSTLDALETPSQNHMPKPSVVIQDRETIQNTRLNTPLTSEAETLMATYIPNPFQRTLATMEPKEQTSNPNKNTKQQPRADGGTSDGTSRTPMDVDAFKRLLLTGSTGTAHSSTSLSPGQSAATNVTDYGSGTDTSSISRQSLNEPSSSTHSDTSRTSYETQISDVDDSASRASTTQKEAKRPAPPPPKPRHGKPVAASTPTPIAGAMQPLGNSTIAPLVVANNPEADINLGQDKNAPDRPRSTHESANSQTSQSKPKPPAPPLARRTSNRMASSTPGSVLASVDSPKTEHSQARAPPPPPPPTRRSAASATALASATSIGRRASDASTQSANELDIEPAKTRPRSSSRSSSIVSGRAVPPPVPPSRRRGSSRSSMDAPSPTEERPGMRLSSEMDRVVEEQLADDASKKDWLADMDALQAEVDALKNQYRHTP